MDCTLKLVTDHPDKARREIRVVVEMTPREAMDVYVAAEQSLFTTAFTSLADSIRPFGDRLLVALRTPKPKGPKYPVGTRFRSLWSNSEYVVIPRPQDKHVEPGENVFFLGLASGNVYAWAEQDVPLMYRVVAA